MSTTGTNLDELAKLAQLKSSGVISEAEYGSLKAKYLAQAANVPTGAVATGPGFTFAGAVRAGFSKYTTFAGRSPRSEFWFWTLFTMLGFIAAVILDAILGTAMSGGQGGLIYLLFALGTLLPGLSMTVRRLHDVDRSGWWYWIILVPFVGAVLLLVWFCNQGSESDNRFGPNPLALRRDSGAA